MDRSETKHILKEAFVESWLGFMALSSYITSVLLGESQIIIGALAVLSAVLFMNGFAKTELFLTSRAPSWWSTHPSLKWLHSVSEEGELAGVLIGIIFFICMTQREHAPHIHLPIAGALALVGIMSAANMAIKKVIPIMAFIERAFGVQIAVFTGALLSSLTGAAASVFVCEYFKERILEEKKADFATRFAAALSLGNGLFPFAAPPILIVWSLLQEKLGWNIGTLLLFIGIPAAIYAFLMTIKISTLLDERSVMDERIKLSIGYQLPILIGIVLGNIIAYDSIFVICLNVAVGLIATINAKGFHGRFGAWALGMLLVSLEIIGSEAGEFVAWLAVTMIPTGVSTLVLGLVLFYLSAFISHFADNALASKLVMTAAIASPAFGLHGDFLAISVVIGALAGGFALIPANLPNFPIARILVISPDSWAKSSIKIYWTIIFFFIWLAGLYFLL